MQRTLVVIMIYLWLPNLSVLLHLAESCWPDLRAQTRSRPGLQSAVNNALLCCHFTAGQMWRQLEASVRVCARARVCVCVGTLRRHIPEACSSFPTDWLTGGWLSGGGKAGLTDPVPAHNQPTVSHCKSSLCGMQQSIYEIICQHIQWERERVCNFLIRPI